MNERCSTECVDHKQAAQARSLPPPPYIPQEEMERYNDEHGIVMVPLSSNIPRIDRKGYSEMQEIKKFKDKNRINQLTIKEKLLAISEKVKYDKIYLDRELKGYNLEAHGLYGKTKKNYLSSSSSLHANNVNILILYFSVTFYFIFNILLITY